MLWPIQYWLSLLPHDRGPNIPPRNGFFFHCPVFYHSPVALVHFIQKRRRIWATTACDGASDKSFKQVFEFWSSYWRQHHHDDISRTRSHKEIKLWLWVLRCWLCVGDWILNLVWFIFFMGELGCEIGIWGLGKWRFISGL